MRHQLVDVLLTLAAALLLAAVLGLIWLSADGRYTPEPSLVTPATAPDSHAVIFDAGDQP